MRFLVDAQLPPALAPWLTARGHEAKAVREVGLRNASDSTIWKYATTEHCVVLTKDEDFVERTLRTSAGPQIVWFRIGNCTNRILVVWLEPLLPSIVNQLQTNVRLVEVKHARA